MGVYRWALARLLESRGFYDELISSGLPRDIVENTSWIVNRMYMSYQCIRSVYGWIRQVKTKERLTLYIYLANMLAISPSFQYCLTPFLYTAIPDTGRAIPIEACRNGPCPRDVMWRWSDPRDRSFLPMTVDSSVEIRTNRESGRRRWPVMVTRVMRTKERNRESPTGRCWGLMRVDSHLPIHAYNSGQSSLDMCHKAEWEGAHVKVQDKNWKLWRSWNSYLTTSKIV